VSRFKGVSVSKPPAFLVDLYTDLRDRRLLPLIALLVVGIIAAPILFKDKSEPAAAPAVPGAGPTPASAASFSVVPAQPSLQDDRERFGHRQAKNPFDAPVGVEHTSGKGHGGNGGEAPEAPAGGTESGSTVTGEETTESSPSGSGPVRYVPVPTPVSYGIDASIGVPGNPHEVRAIRPQTKLPSSKNPVVIYMGPSRDKKHALFLLSSQVLSYTGPVKCAAEKSNCQLLEIGFTAPVHFLYGGKERHFTLTVERFVPILQLPNGKERVVHGH